MQVTFAGHMCLVLYDKEVKIGWSYDKSLITNQTFCFFHHFFFKYATNVQMNYVLIRVSFTVKPCENSLYVLSKNEINAHLIDLFIHYATLYAQMFVDT